MTGGQKSCMILAVIILLAAMINPMINQKTSDNVMHPSGRREAAEYAGYLTRDGKTYPIVIIGGEERISRWFQPVRDASYVGRDVTIVWQGDEPDMFRIEWFPIEDAGEPSGP